MLPPKAVRVSEIASFNLEQNSGSTLDDEPIPGTVTLVDGQVLTNIDRVIICTGYHCTFPFLSQYHRDSVPATDADETVLVTDGLQMHNLHKDIFYIPDPTLAFIGVPYYTATFSLFDFQAITVAAVFSGKAHLPTETEMRAEYNQRVQEKGFGRIFHSLRGKDVDYVNELLAWINPSIVAAGGEPVEGHTKEWKEQYAALREKFKAFLGDQPKPDVEKQNAEVLSETAEAIEVH
jgi:MFS transporter, ACS family, pantothenate transporter